MKLVLLLFSFIIGSAGSLLVGQNCQCFSGDTLLEYYVIKEPNRLDTISFLITDSINLTDFNYRKVYLQKKELDNDSLLGYVRQSNDCNKIFFFNRSLNTEQIIYDIALNRFDKFSVDYCDLKNVNYKLYHELNVVYDDDSIKQIELIPQLPDSSRFKITFIQGVGSTYPFYFGSPPLLDSYYGVTRRLFMKISDGRTIYYNGVATTPSITDNIITSIDTLSKKDIYYYADLVYKRDETIYNSVESTKDLFFIIDRIDWDGALTLIDKLIDHPMCDYGTALMTFWYNDPNFYISKIPEDPSGKWWEDGFNLHNKLMKRLLEGYYKKSEIYFDPSSFYSIYLNDLLYIPLALRIPSKGVKYIRERI